jgi:nitrogen fixation/metabolism regulation signal transduction histidine kinase
MHASAEIVGNYIVSDIEFDYPVTTNITLRKLAKYDEIKNIVVFKSNGTLFAKYYKPGYEEFKAKFSLDDKNYYSEDGFLYINHIIHSDAQKIVGVIELRISTQTLYERMKVFFFYVSVFALITAFIAIFIGIRLSKSFSKPILSLAEVMQRVSDEQNYDLRVSKKGNDEIGVLYEGFNNMMIQITRKEEERYSAISSLEKSENNFRNIFDASHDAILFHDEYGKIYKVNRTMLSMFRVSKKVALNSTIMDFSSDKNEPINLEKICKEVLYDGKKISLNCIEKKKR